MQNFLPKVSRAGAVANRHRKKVAIGRWTVGVCNQLPASISHIVSACLALGLLLA